MNTPAPGIDAFWAYTRERQAIFERREAGQPAPWTDDPVLRDYFFTNVFRTNDFTIRYLIDEVIHGKSEPNLPRPLTPTDVLFRLILFQFFNLPAMWNELVMHGIALTWDEFVEDRDKAVDLLTKKWIRGERIYTGAYSVPVGALRLGGKINVLTGEVHIGHINLTIALMESSLPAKIMDSKSFEEMYRALLLYRGFGSFTGYQLALDLTYTDFIPHTDDEFVIAGPGACVGLSRIYDRRVTGAAANRYIRELVDSQPAFAANGKRATLADIEHTLCEYARYCKITDPNIPPARKHKRRFPRTDRLI